MLLFSMIFMVVAFAVDARACDHMAPIAASDVHAKADYAQDATMAIAGVHETTEVARADLHDGDRCLPMCCQSNVCCHLILIPPVPDFSSARGNNIVALVAVTGTPRSTEPDVPPPKTA
jgi:hypothetical protein